ncbi:MAG: hypothetical protein LBP22_03410 [Deltaproteobacteria bacterium]|jgi:hypothetical protein|nr:hypothetical protein [Deltaproteobacteria bacterium]
MSKIFELFGYRLDAWNKNAVDNCAKAWCPFMDEECDGGGNRYLSALDLRSRPKLAAKFSGKDIVQAGVCSLSLKEGEQPWIVCPRRLLSLKERSHSMKDHQTQVKQQLHKFLKSDTDWRVWSEVKMKTGVTSVDGNQEKSFDYTFDYIISTHQRMKLSDVATITGKSERSVQKVAEENGYTLARRGDLWVDDFPCGPFLIIEIMTSSTSGGDKKKRTQIGMAFEDAVLNPASHNAPGINYRQVWARMVSQLIVKSQVAIAWGGITLWLIQDVLADYISESTALDLSSFLSEQANEVNLLAFGYGPLECIDGDDQILELKCPKLYSGPIDSQGNERAQGSGGFVDIIKIGAAPPQDILWRSLFLKRPCASFST